jgi:hypothetical protein
VRRESFGETKWRTKKGEELNDDERGGDRA